MNKKKIIIIIVAIIFILMLIPIPIKLRDGGSTEYKAILYKVTKIHSLNEQSLTGYEDGWKIEIFGIQVYYKVDNYNHNKNHISKDKIIEEKIYKTIEGGESSWAYDLTIPSNLINDHPESNYVVRVKVLSVGEGEMLPKQENLYNPFTCFTPIKMQVIDNLLDTNTLSGTITAYITGGKMKIANILKGTKQEIEYMGIYDISQVDPEQYIEYKWATPYYEPNVNDEYVMIINKTNPNLNQIMCGGYGIFKVEKQDNGKEIYRNVISEKILEM